MWVRKQIQRVKNCNPYLTSVVASINKMNYKINFFMYIKRIHLFNPMHPVEKNYLLYLGISNCKNLFDLRQGIY